MDKKNIIIVILVSMLIISGYFLFQKNDDKNIVFENNLKCAQYIEQQNKEINKIADLPINEGKVVTAPKIFFSPKLNTCISAFLIEDLRENGSGHSGFYIYNLLNNDSILTEGGTTASGGTIEIAEQKYRTRLKELGGE